MLIKAFRKYRDILKKEKEITAAQRRLARVPLDYIALQQIADTVSSGYNVQIEVKQPDGTHIIITRSKPQNEINFESFRDKYNKYHGE
jgi:hypothetical protein